jgi:hypothetical protein
LLVSWIRRLRLCQGNCAAVSSSDLQGVGARGSHTHKYCFRSSEMRVREIVDPGQQRVNAMQQQAKAAQKRAKEAALRLRLQKTQKQLTQVAAKPL